jgi:hypothetical protein
MSDTDPLDRLSRVANQAEQPDAAFSDRLLDDLLSSLTADGPTPTVSSVDQPTNEPTAEVIMLSPDRNQLHRPRRGALLVAASVAAFALIGGLLFIANRDDVQPSDEPTPTLPVQADPITPTSTFDGDTCTYSGPDEFDVGSEVTFTLIDDSGTNSVGFSVWQVPEGTTAQEIFDEGIFNNGSQLVESAPAEITATGIRVTYLFDRAGLYAINCADRPQGGPAVDHATLFTVVG